MSKFQFSGDAHINANKAFLKEGRLSDAFDVLAKDVDKQLNAGKRRWHHKKRESDYTEIGRGFLQIATTPPVEDDVMIFYVDEKSGRGCVRAEKEFEDGRFEEIKDAE